MMHLSYEGELVPLCPAKPYRAIQALAVHDAPDMCPRCLEIRRSHPASDIRLRPRVHGLLEVA